MQTMLYSNGKEVRVGHRDGTAQLVDTPAGPSVYLDSDFIGFLSTPEDSGFIMPRVLYPLAKLQRIKMSWKQLDPLKNPDNELATPWFSDR